MLPGMPGKHTTYSYKNTGMELGSADLGFGLFTVDSVTMRAGSIETESRYKADHQS